MGEALSASPPFLQKFQGRFESILRWPMLDELWAVLRDNPQRRWFVYAVGEAVPVEPLEHADLLRFIGELDELLRKDHAEDYCGVVYVDDRRNPSLIKVFDPNNLGASCGSSGQTILPGWVISELPPCDLPDAFPQTGSRKRWWQKIFGA
ncbi:MAG: hypothetical protein KDJ38_16000 [Gammaproteobacteria bacterium]|nr:hypothetical protein [Gammaproteobacteria bacterium]